MRVLERCVDALLGRLVPHEEVAAQDICDAECRCQGGAQADMTCVSRIGYYCRAIYCDGSVGPWTFNGCC